ncbi:MAG: hypothetical protein QOE26_1299 [Verrucomicrobiota bacterium]
MAKLPSLAANCTEIDASSAGWPGRPNTVLLPNSFNFSCVAPPLTWSGDNVQKITKLLASEDGKTYLDFDIGKGIDVGQTMTLHWDKSTNKSGCEWYLKAVYADKSVGEAVKFDFCAEDLLISF